MAQSLDWIGIHTSDIKEFSLPKKAGIPLSNIDVSKAS